MERHQDLAGEKTRLRIRASGHNQLGMHQEAVKDCEELIGMDMNDPESYGLLGFYLEKNGEIDKAMECYRHMMKLFPNYHDSYVGLGYCFEVYKKRLNMARVCYEKALELNPRDHWALNNAAVLLQKEGKWHEALSYYERALEVVEKEGEEGCHIRHNLAWAHYHCGNYDEAFTLYKNLSNNHPADYVAIHSIFADYACVQYKMELFNDALESLDRALWIHPKNRRCRRLYNVTIKRIK